MELIAGWLLGTILLMLCAYGACMVVSSKNNHDSAYFTYDGRIDYERMDRDAAKRNRENE